jgi:hypothetical protein
MVNFKDGSHLKQPARSYMPSFFISFFRLITVYSDEQFGPGPFFSFPLKNMYASASSVRCFRMLKFNIAEEDFFKRYVKQSVTKNHARLNEYCGGWQYT